MSEVIRELDAVTLARIGSHSQTLRMSLEGKIALGEAPHSVDTLNAVWDALVQYPIPEEASEWIVTAVGALLAEQLRVLYSFRWKELVDEYGASPCMVENRTGVRVFPFDTIARRLQAQERAFFGTYLGEIQSIMEAQGLTQRVQPNSESATVSPATTQPPPQKPWWRLW